MFLFCFQIWCSFQCAMEVRTRSLAQVTILAYFLLLRVVTEGYTKQGTYIIFIYYFSSKSEMSLDLFYVFVGSVSCVICPRGLLCLKFDAEKLSFKAFFRIMRIFGSVEPKSESLLFFILSRSNRILVLSSTFSIHW